MNSIHDATDVLTIMMWFTAGVMSLLFCWRIVSTNLEPYTLADKSSIELVGEAPEPYQWTVRDYLLMLMVADEYCPEPKCVDLKLGVSMQDTRMEFNESYVANLEGRLQKYYINYISGRVDDPIVSYDYYYEGEGENGRWRFVVEH